MSFILLQGISQDSLTALQLISKDFFNVNPSKQVYEVSIQIKHFQEMPFKSKFKEHVIFLFVKKEYVN